MASDRINIFIYLQKISGTIFLRHNGRMCRTFSIITMRNVNYNFSVLTFAVWLPCERANANKLYFVTSICVYLQTSVDTRPRRAHAISQRPR